MIVDKRDAKGKYSGRFSPGMPAASLPSDDVQRLAQSAFSLRGVIEEAATLAAQAAGEKGLGFRWYLDADAPVPVTGDADALRAVLGVLLGNAVRFTAAGEVRLDARVEAAAGEEGPGGGPLLRFNVIDTGVGFERDAAARVFDDGNQLADCRRMVRLMGGDLHVHSLPGHGATFWFTARFPFSPQEGGEAGREVREPVSQGGLRPLRILIAEDNAVNQFILTEQLRSMGHRSVAVTNGGEAMAAVESAEWDAIFLDCQMPVMDGYETAAAIRAREAGGARRLWTIAITANALDGQREACLRAGMDDFLSKPFALEDLARVLERIPARGDDGPAPVDMARLDALAAAKAGNGENLLERMVYLFTESGPPMLDQMDRAIMEVDFIAAVGAAHKLAGGCTYFGAEELHSLCAEAERLGRAGDHAGIRAIAPRIRREYDRVAFALRRGRAAR